MLDLAELTGSLPVRPDGRGLVAAFVPPPRFAGKGFGGYQPRHPSQRAARTRLEELAGELRAPRRSGLPRWLHRALTGNTPGAGTYLDGGFGVGKTHLLAALWNAAPQPKAYLSFDELVYFIGLVGIGEARSAFADRRLIAVDEWELDDPGNLKIALAFLRGAIDDGAHVVVTSNTLPLELGAGRFSQKDFQAEIEELAGAFEVLRIEGDDYRHRHFEADPGREYFVERSQAVALAGAAGRRALLVPLPELTRALAAVHPIRYAAIVEPISHLFVVDLRRVESLPDALRWVHFVDTLYDSSVPMTASSEVPLGELFPHAFVSGPFGKKISRCLSRMEELLSEKEGAA